jgi:hypothetical protein
MTGPAAPNPSSDRCRVPFAIQGGLSFAQRSICFARFKVTPS